MAHGWRRAAAGAIVAALAVIATIAIRPDTATPVTVTRFPASGQPSATVAPTTTSVATTSTTVTTTSTVVERDLEQMIGDMYFAWFDGVHRRDMATIETIAGADTVIEWAEGAFGNVEFTAEPTREAITVTVKRVLLDRPDCLVVSADVDYRTFLAGDVHSTVDVYFPVGDGWGFARKYLYEREMWLVDCDHLARR